MRRKNKDIKIGLTKNDFTILRREAPKKNSNILISTNSSSKEELNKNICVKNNMAVFLTHFGLGDHINTLPIVIYLSSLYDSITIICIKNYYNNLKAFYENNDKIKISHVNESERIYPLNNLPNFLKKFSNHDIYITGIHKKNHMPFNYLPFNFYDDIKLDYSIFWNKFIIPDTKISNKLYDLLKDKKYYFIHNSTSYGELFNIDNIPNIDNNYIIINPCKNMYLPIHEHYELAEKFVNHLILDYKQVIMHANKLYLSDSSFFCLAINIELDTDECYVFPRNNKINYDYIWKPKYKYDKTSGKKVFTTIDKKSKKIV